MISETIHTSKVQDEDTGTIFEVASNGWITIADGFRDGGGLSVKVHPDTLAELVDTIRALLQPSTKPASVGRLPEASGVVYCIDRMPTEDDADVQGDVIAYELDQNGNVDWHIRPFDDIGAAFAWMHARAEIPTIYPRPRSEQSFRRKAA